VARGHDLQFSRLAAVTIDIFLWFSIYALAMTVAKRLYAEDDPAGKEAGESIYLVGLLILLFVQTIFLSIRGQTVGKMVMRIRIVRVVDEANPGFVGAVLYRVFITGVIALIPGVGPLFALADVLYIFANDRRCLHDRIAGTKVVVV